MGSPWNSPRHRSWASDTVVTGAMLAVLILTTGIVDAFGEPPTYLVGLLGTAAGAFFGAIGSDKQKREREVAQQASRAERKANHLADFAGDEHPGSTLRADIDEIRGEGEGRR